MEGLTWLASNLEPFQYLDRPSTESCLPFAQVRQSEDSSRTFSTMTDANYGVSPMSGKLTLCIINGDFAVTLIYIWKHYPSWRRTEMF